MRKPVGKNTPERNLNLLKAGLAHCSENQREAIIGTSFTAGVLLAAVANILAIKVTANAFGAIETPPEQTLVAMLCVQLLYHRHFLQDVRITGQDLGSWLAKKLVDTGSGRRDPPKFRL